VLAVAGTSVLAFQNAETMGECSFLVVRMDRWKGRGSFVSVESGRGRRLKLTTSILSKTAGARDERKFFNGLIAWPAQTGEDRIFVRGRHFGGVN
jgi:hypothetical protein